MALILEHLQMSYGTQPLFQPLCHQFAPGTCVAVCGRSGTGKSSLLRGLAGWMPFSQGSASWKGVNIPVHPRAQQRFFRQEVAWLGPEPLLDPQASVWANCLLSAAFQAIPQAEEACRSLLDQCQLTPYAAQAASSLSTGQAVRVGLMRALLHPGQLILADEPTAPLDAESGQQVLDMLCQHVRKHNRLLVVASHDPQLIAACDAVIELQPCGA